jgi:hypothetical protein
MRFRARSGITFFSAFCVLERELSNQNTFMVKREGLMQSANKPNTYHEQTKPQPQHDNGENRKRVNPKVHPLFVPLLPPKSTGNFSF